MTNTHATNAAFIPDDPSLLTHGYLTAHHLRTHGPEICRGMFLLSSIGSEDDHGSDLGRNYEAIVEFAAAATGEKEQRQIMATAFRDHLCDLVALAYLFEVDLHKVVDAAIISTRDNLGLPTAMVPSDDS